MNRTIKICNFIVAVCFIGMVTAMTLVEKQPIMLLAITLFATVGVVALDRRKKCQESLNNDLYEHMDQN